MTRKRKPVAHVALRRAREAARAGDWERASAHYDVHWDASEGDYTTVGVRRSYGLREWAEVGQSYPAAIERMRELLREALAKYESTGDTWWLLDGHALDRALGSRAAIELTVRLHEGGSPRAKNAVFCLWRELVEAGHEVMVAAELGDPERQYAPSLAYVDIFEKMKRRGQLRAGHDSARVRFRETARLLIRLLEVGGRFGERAEFEQRARRDAENRGFSLEG